MLDVGAGDGWFAGELGREAEGAAIVCWDVNYRSADLAADLPAGVVRIAAEPEGTFDLVLLLDVVEHVEDDGGFLDRSIVPHLGPDGVLIVSVPAYQALFSAHDEALAHHRRYSPRQLRALLAPRFEIVARGGLFASLLPARAQGSRERLARCPAGRGPGHRPLGPGAGPDPGARSRPRRRRRAGAVAGRARPAHARPVDLGVVPAAAGAEPMSGGPDCTVVVPCYNEAARFDLEPVAELIIAKADVRVLAVDDGSTDATGAAGRPSRPPSRPRGRAPARAQPRQGRAVRHGLREAVASGAELVAYCDADFAAPPAEVARLVDTLRADVGLGAVIASRVAMLGTDIRRSAVRHYRWAPVRHAEQPGPRGAGVRHPVRRQGVPGRAAAGGGAVPPSSASGPSTSSCSAGCCRAGASRCRCSPGTTRRERT